MLDMPILATSRPALALVEEIGHGATFSFERAAEVAAKPRTTVTRYLQELVGASLLVRLRRDHYASPSRPTAALLRAETSPYYRNVLLWHDVLTRLGDAFAFACLPVRSSLGFDIPRAIPVVPLADDLRRRTPRYSGDVLRFNFRRAETGKREIRFPSEAQDDPGSFARTVPVLVPATALALLACVADSRLVKAVTDAAPRMGLSAHEILDRARSLYPERAPLNALLDNTVVLPKWLEAFAGTARSLQAHRFVETASDAMKAGERKP